MLLRVFHQTGYAYEPPVRTAQHMAHLKPAQAAGQQLLGHRLDISPVPASRSEVADIYGNMRTFFSHQAAHAQLVVTAESVVATAAAPLPAANSISWELACEHMRYHRGARYDPAADFAFASPYVPRHPSFQGYAQASFTPGRQLFEAASDLMRRIHHDFEYEPQATDASTPALEALRLRKGVCQDFAHIMLGCLRSLGLSARYVSGYLLTQPPPGQPTLVGSDASHAWVSLYLPPTHEGLPGHWVGLDPTNNRLAGEDYVVLATGRDYSDVSPMRGMIEGGAHHTLDVAVTVEPLAAGDWPAGLPRMPAATQPVG